MGNDSEKLEDKVKPDYETFAEFLESQDEGVRELYEEHTHGLKSALEKEREERKNTSDRLKELKESAEKGSKLEEELGEKIKALDEAEEKYQQTQKKLTFIESASKPDVRCGNPVAAWAVAVSNDAFDKHGEPDWDAIKEIAPELFGKTSTDAGKQTPVTANDINADIRSKAGYKSK